MDTWKFFDLTHREHLLCNPTSPEKLDEVLGLLRLRPGARVLELASGKGEFLVRLAERHPDIEAVGVDLSPYCVADARRKHRARAPQARLSFVEMNGAAYRPEHPEGFDLTVCLGASWIFKGYRGTLLALRDLTAPGGLILAGEPYWRQSPPAGYLQASGLDVGLFGTHAENMAAGEPMGLTPLYTWVSNLDEWDRYEGLQWYAAENYAREQPADPDAPELLRRVRHNRSVYLRWGRETLGWAMYLFRR